MRSYKFIISGGGTGGHIFPAVAIANGIRERYPNAEILHNKRIPVAAVVTTRALKQEATEAAKGAKK